MASFTVKKDSARDLTSTSFDNDIFYEANGYPDAVKFDGPPTIGATKQEVDSEDEEQNEINSVETLVERLNKEMEHRGPQSKAKPRKKGIDADNELEIVSRKLLNVAFDENAAANAIPQEKYLSPNDPSTIKYLLPTHGNSIISALNHPELQYVLNSIKQIRRYMCIDEVADKTDRVLELGIMPRLRSLLLKSDINIQYEVCWVLTNIAAGTSEHTAAVVFADMTGPLIELLESESDQVRVQAAWALGNIAGDCKDFTQQLLDAGVMPPLLAIPNLSSYNVKKDMQAKHVVCWVIANICRWSNKDWSQIELSFPLLTEIILNGRDDDVLSEAIWALSRIFHTRHSANEKLMTKRLIAKLVKLIHSPRLAVQTPVLRVMTNISGEHDPAHTQILIDAGVLPSIKSILDHNHLHSANILAEALHCLSNITAGTTSQKETVSNAQLFDPVRRALAFGDIKVKKEAGHVLRNAVDRDATPEHFRDVVGPQGEIFESLTTFLVDLESDPETQLHIVETLNIIFSRGDEPLIRQLYPFAVPGTNVYVTCMNYVNAQNFERIWALYYKLNSCDEDLAPLLNQCVVADREVKELGKNGLNEKRRSGVEIVVEHFKGMKATDFVKETRTKKALIRDLNIMLDTYLPDQKAAKLQSHFDLDSMSTKLFTLGIDAI